MNTKPLSFCLIVILILVISGCTQKENIPSSTPSSTSESTPGESQEIVLGAMFPLTGDGAAYGEPLSQQLMLSVDEINAAGGIQGKKIKLVLEDSKCTPKDGSNAANKLVNVDKVKVIFGGACSGETLGAAPIAEQNHVIIISPAATSPDLTKAGDYIFRTAPSDAYAGKVAAEKALALGFKKAAIINENTDYAQGLRKVFDKVFTDKGGVVASKESYNPEETDFKTQILKIKEAKPDVIYVVPQTPAKGVLLVKQLKEQGVSQQLITAEVLIGRDVVKEHGKDIEGLIGVEAAFNEKGALAAKTLDSFRAKHGEPPWPFYQAATRDAVYLIADAIRDHGLDSDEIKKALYATKDWEGAIGKLTIDENGDPILGYSIKQVKNSGLIELSPGVEAVKPTLPPLDENDPAASKTPPGDGKDVVVESK